MAMSNVLAFPKNSLSWEKCNKAAPLAAERQALLTLSKVPPSIKHELLKDMAPDVQYWTKAVRRPFIPGSDSGGGEDGGDDGAGEDFTQGPLQNILTQLVQRHKKTPRRSSTTPAMKKTKTTLLRPLIAPINQNLG